MVQGLKPALAVMRYSLAAFLLIWVIEKFIKPETTVAIWKAFYLVETMPVAGSYVIGVIQAIALLGLVLGVAKTFTYGFWVVIHGIGTILTYQTLMNPYQGANHLFWAAVPVLGALVALFLLRKEDTLFTLGK